MVAGGGGYTLAPMAWKWLGVIALTIFTTVHMQDIPDQGGDRVRGRNTVPLVLGDGPARWTVMSTMSVCSLGLPMFWNLNLWGFPMIFVGIGAMVIWRVFAKRSVNEDKVTWRIWNLWISSAYLLPFIKSLEMM